MSTKLSGVTIHPSAIIEEGVEIGEESSVWDNVHIRRNARIGHHSIIGEKTYIAYDVVIGNYVKVNSFVYICASVTIEDMVMIAAGTVFTNDKYPRAYSFQQQGLATSEPDENTLPTLVKKGVTIGANATIGPGITIGEYAMIGMGSVVTADVLPYQLAYGNPAVAKGFVCRCGQFLLDKASLEKASEDQLIASCSKCNVDYLKKDSTLKSKS
jgi:acetyltransferase-like isoleucine patch superfamily enzyme